jgi:hypothetical protein
VGGEQCKDTRVRVLLQFRNLFRFSRDVSTLQDTL